MTTFNEISSASEVKADPLEPHEVLKPLQDLIARGEGHYNSVNRGYAGDTPGGIQSLTGLTFENYTVGQVMQFQRRWLYAVGRYQFIPVTLRFAVRNSDVHVHDMFTPEVQDRLMLALVMKKRPALGAYIRGEHDNIHRALNAMAREWASIEYRYGRSYYAGVGGNRAKVSRAEAARVLRIVRTNWQTI